MAQPDRGFLKESPLFENLGEGEISRLVEMAQIREFDSGGTIVEEGTTGDSIFLLYDGSVSIGMSDNSGGQISLASLDTRGAFFGEIGVIDPGPRSATVKAESHAVLLELTVAGLEDFFGEHSDAEAVVMRNIARVLAQRLRGSNLLMASR